MKLRIFGVGLKWSGASAVSIKKRSTTFMPADIARGLCLFAVLGDVDSTLLVCGWLGLVQRPGFYFTGVSTRLELTSYSNKHRLCLSG